MSEKPYIYLAFANSPNRPLPFLKQEWRILRGLLQTLDKDGLIQLTHTQATEISDIIAEFNNLKDLICIFHYAGHAGEDHLLLEDGKAISDDLAKLIAEQKNIELVVLNGCSTLRQVDKLLSLGVPAVIATEAPVGDESAMKFAEIFYRALVNKRTIRSAFDFAKSGMKVDAKKNKSIGIYYKDRSGNYRDERGLIRDRLDEEDKFPWGLYYDLEKVKALTNNKYGEAQLLNEYPQWELPRNIRIQDRPRERNGNKQSFLLGLKEEMVRYEPKVQKDFENSDGFEIDDKKHPPKILMQFPWPISAQLRKLIAKRGPFKEHGLFRMKQIVQAYQAIMSFLSFILLSQLWDNWRIDHPGEVTLKKTKTILDHINRSDYYQLFIELCEIIQERQLSFFIEELPDGFPKDLNHDIWKSYAFLDKIRKDFEIIDDQDESIAKKSEQAEEHLTIILKQLAFLAKYRLVAINDIHIQKIKHLGNATYHHVFSELHAGMEGDIEYDSRLNVLFGPVYTKSVMLISRDDYSLIKDKNKLSSIPEVERIVKEKVLSLSPFIIDRHAFEKNNYDDENDSLFIFILDHISNDNYRFKNVEYNFLKAQEYDDDWLDIGSGEFEVLIDQFELIKQDFNL